MSGARERVLANIRAALNRRAPLAESVAAALDARLKTPRVNVQPAVDDDLIERFVKKMEAVHAAVAHVDTMDKISETVDAHLKQHDLPPDLVVAPDPELEGIPWSNRFAIERRAASGDDRVSVTGAFAGIAESGTLVLLSGPESPTTLNFLPDDHIVVLRSDRIVTYMEDVWTRLRKERGGLPRTVNFITGPSKTADVEQTIQEGAHGPRRLRVILVG